MTSIADELKPLLERYEDAVPVRAVFCGPEHLPASCEPASVPAVVTAEHPASSHGLPVVVLPSGAALGPQRVAMIECSDGAMRRRLIQSGYRARPPSSQRA